MINLLPNEEKIELSLGMKRTVLVISSTFIIFFLVCLSLVLYAVQINFQSTLEERRNLLEASENQATKKEFQDMELTIKQANSGLEKLTPFYKNQFHMSTIIKEITELLPPNSYLKSIFVTTSQTSQQEARISLSGFILKREQLTEFKNTLEKKEHFKNIVFPASNWIKPTDIEFSANFSIIQ